MVAPAEFELEALVLHVTSVDGRCLTADDERRCGARHEQVLGLLDEVVDAEGQASAEEDTVETEVQLLRGLPFQLVVTHRCGSNALSVLDATAEGIETTLRHVGAVGITAQ